jgi:hypothetical protein
LGTLEQIVFERHLSPPSTEQALVCFARDAMLIRELCGEVREVTALISPRNEVSSILNIQLASTDGSVSRWTHTAAEPPDGLKILLVGSQGSATYLHAPGSSSHTWELRIGRDVERKEWPSHLPAKELLERLTLPAFQPRWSESWREATRSIELADAARRSLARHRTISLSEPEASETANFRSFMATLGCGILLAGLGLVFLVSLADKIAVEAGWDRVHAVLRRWPWLLVLLLVGFLALQGLSLALSQKHSERSQPGPAAVRPKPDGPRTAG